MRFAYIDSQGNELPIPSVDALALRIELGAIGPDTQLYDAQADRWGPAHTHEIFHTLSRDVAGEEGFVAPPPPVAPPPVPSGEESAPSEVSASEPLGADDVGTSEPEADAPVFDLSGGVEVEGAPSEEELPTPAGAEDQGFGLDLTLAPMDGGSDGGDAGAGVGDFGAGSAETAGGFESDAMSFGAGGDDGPESAGTADGDEGAGAFDFGDMGALELEGSPAEEEPMAPDEDPAMEIGSAIGGGGHDASDGAMSFGGGDMGGGLDLEQPMSEFSADSPPSWMEDDDDAGAEEAEGSMSFEQPALGHDDATSDDAAEGPRSRPAPRSRPSPPRRPKKSPVGMIAGVVGVVVVAGGGYFGWQAFSGGRAERQSEEATPALPAVTIPDIPVELLPQMRDLGEAALADMIVELRGMQGEFDMPVEPRNDWLAGVYLANASQFRDVQEYWEGIEAFVGRVRNMDTQVFHEKYVAQLEAAGVVGDTAAMLLERADSGFLATRDDRFEAYALMDDLVRAALDLHRFLLANEANISYEPAAGGVSRDPVLEAVPSSREIGNQMWDMVDRITGALDALGTLDRVTTERLSAVLFDRVRRASFR